MSNTPKIVSITAVRALRLEELSNERAYQIYIDGMEKLDLLNELVAFQEERTKEGKLTPGLLVRGRILFTALEAKAESDALLSLMRAYRKHLEYEREEYLQQVAGDS